MIKLDSTIYDSIKNEYFNLMLPKIQDEYQTVKASNQKNIFDGSLISAFFETSGGAFDVQFIYSIICEPLIINPNMDDRLKNYLKTGVLLQLKHMSVQQICQLYGKTPSFAVYRAIRSDVVKKYNNSWIAPIVARHIGYEANGTNYIQLMNEIEMKFKDFNSHVEKMFNYDNISAELRHRLLLATGITACPYCNRQYISNYVYSDGRKTTADLDHFYPKSIYSLLGLSLYNFIPSCAVCNRTFKLDSTRKILYPFNDGFGNDAFFECDLNANSDVGTILGHNTKFDLSICNKAKKAKRYEIEQSKTLFRLEPLYESHKKKVREHIYLRYIEQNPYYHTIIKQLNISPDEAEKLLYGSNGEDVNVPFSKLYSDLKKQGF